VLTAYETATLQLFQAATSVVPLISTPQLDANINSARAQVAAEGECIRATGTLALTANVQGYPFSSISTGNPAIPTVIAIRSCSIGPLPLDVRGWEWFAAYYLGRSPVGSPRIVAQQGQGVSGTVFFSPIPNGALTAAFDAVCLPETLVDDSTPEAIPYPWTDAVPFWATWLCMMNAQRQADADMMFSRYEQIMMRLARMGVTPSELPSNMPMDRGLRLQQGG
jgi:hypothetical protein